MIGRRRAKGQPGTGLLEDRIHDREAQPAAGHGGRAPHEAIAQMRQHLGRELSP